MMNWHINYVTGTIESIDEMVEKVDVLWHVIDQAGRGNPEALLAVCVTYATDEVLQDLIDENIALQLDAEGERERMGRECRP